MKLSELAAKLELDIRTGADHLEAEVTRGYASDLLSDVMANAEEGDVWVTLQTHQNIVAVVIMKSLAAILLVNGRQPDEATVQKAAEENVPILISKLSTFDLVGKLFELGITGS